MAVEAIRWGRGRKQAFIDWFGHELHQTIGDRAPLERVWSDNIVQWRARIVGDGVADIPFVGASDIEMPLTAMHVDPVMADFMQTLHVPQDFYSIVAKRPDMVETAKPLQKFLSRVERGYVQMRRVNAKVLQDMTIHGTGIYKDYILHDRRMMPSRSGEVVPQLIHQPRIQHVPLQDFFIPAYAYDIDPDAPNGAAPWVAQRFYLTKEQLKERATAESPAMPAYDRDVVADILLAEEEVEDAVQRTIDQQNKYTPFHRRKIELYEVHARFAPDVDGIARDIVVVWHQRSRRILRAMALPFMHGRRPFEAAIYLPGMGFYGMGVAEIDEWAQLALSRIMNNVIDNTLIANSVMIGAPAGMNIGPDEPIHPMKVFTLGPNEDLKTVQLGRPNPQAAGLLQMLMQWSEQRVSVSELRQGDISSLPSRTPASSVLSILSEGKKRFDMILSNLREGPLHNLGVRMLQNIQQITQTGDPRWTAFAVQALGEAEGMLVKAVLEGPIHDVDSRFGISVTATNSQVNRELEKGNILQLAQSVTQLDQLLLQYAQMSQNPMVIMATAQAAYNGATELKRRLLESHDVANPDAFMPMQQGPQAPGMPMPAAPTAAAPAPATPVSDPAMLLNALRGAV